MKVVNNDVLNLTFHCITLSHLVQFSFNCSCKSRFLHKISKSCSRFSTHFLHQTLQFCQVYNSDIHSPNKQTTICSTICWEYKVYSVVYWDEIYKFERQPTYCKITKSFEAFESHCYRHFLSLEESLKWHLRHEWWGSGSAGVWVIASWWRQWPETDPTSSMMMMVSIWSGDL